MSVDQMHKNAYHFIPIPLPAAAGCANIGVQFKRRCTEEEAYLLYDSNAGRDVEADAGLPRRKHYQRADFGSSSTRSARRCRI
jgi:hypothetical protein